MFIFSILSLIAVGVSKIKGPSRIFGSLIIVLIGLEIITLLILALFNDANKKIISFLIKMFNCWAYFFFFFILINGCIEDSMRKAFGNAVRILLLIIFEITGFISFIIFICTFIFMCRGEISDEKYFKKVFKIATHLFRSKK